MEESVNLAAAVASHDLSMFSLFVNASLTVKLIIILLIFCSIWSWTIIFSKFSVIRKLKRRAAKFEEAFWTCGSIENLYTKSVKAPKDPLVFVFLAGMKEWKNSSSKAVKNAGMSVSLKDRIFRMMHVTAGKEIEALEKYVSFLGTVGSTAPFVGLFGTVWGIMGVIAGEANMNLATVAPGIAEALFATALGLIVTIPAVIAYNKIVLEITRYQNRLYNFIDEFYSIISKYIEDSEDA